MEVVKSKLLTLTAVLLFTITGTAFSEVKHKVVVFRFADLTGKEEYGDLSIVMSSAVRGDLEKTGNFVVVSKSETPTNVVSSFSEAFKTAKKLKADIGVIGAYTILGGRILVAIDVYDFAKHRVRLSIYETGSSDPYKVFEVVDKVSKKVVNAMVKELPPERNPIVIKEKTEEELVLLSAEREHINFSIGLIPSFNTLKIQSKCKWQNTSSGQFEENPSFNGLSMAVFTHITLYDLFILNLTLPVTYFSSTVRPGEKSFSRINIGGGFKLSDWTFHISYNTLRFEKDIANKIWDRNEMELGYISCEVSKNINSINLNASIKVGILVSDDFTLDRAIVNPGSTDVNDRCSARTRDNYLSSKLEDKSGWLIKAGGVWKASDKISIGLSAEANTYNATYIYDGYNDNDGHHEAQTTNTLTVDFSQLSILLSFNYKIR